MIAGFCVLVKTRVYSLIPAKKVRDSVSELKDFHTHRIARNYLTYTKFKN
jgi:hypothetical protein